MEDTTTPIHMDGTARDKLMKLLPPDLILMLMLMPMAGDTTVDTTVPTTMDGMARGKLMRLLPLDLIPMLMLMPMAGDTMVDTTVLITMATTARGKLMSLLPLDLIPMLMLMVGDTTEGTDTVPSTMAMAGENKFPFFLSIAGEENEIM